MQLKAYLKQTAQQHAISPQLLLQELVLDDLLERISLSPYRTNLVLKGGFLIGSLIGINTRSTMDLDTTVIGLNLTKIQILTIFKEICHILPQNDLITLTPTKIEPIRHDDAYGGFRVHIDAQLFSLKPTIKVDVSTGDKITPKEVTYHHQLITENRKIPILTYNLETIFAEKLETILSRTINNTRPKDFYDLHMLWQLEKQNIDLPILKQALTNTAIKRGSQTVLSHYQTTLALIINDSKMNQRWETYQRHFSYAETLSFTTVCTTILTILKKIN